MHRFRPFPALAIAATLALVLAACSGTTASPSSSASEPPPSASAPESVAPSESAAPSEAAEEVRVRLDGFAFDPAELTIPAGTEVTFLNADSATHTVTEGTNGEAVADPIINVELAANQADSFTFDEPGTYEITCLIHPSMHLTITVEG